MITSENRSNERPVMLEIEKITSEAKDIRTFWVSSDMEVGPGQFVMLWIPGAGQKPFGISYKEDGKIAITIRNVGKFTGKLFQLKTGDKLGIQGPYGKPFSIRPTGKGKNAVLVGGGYGTAPLGFLADELLKQGKKVFFVIGAVSKDYIVFRERYGKKIKGKDIELFFSTDDGSFGQRGLCTDCLEKLLTEKKIDSLYCCGPEIMMKKVMQICIQNRIRGEFSLERYMKCGFGTCGSCCMDPTGWRVCKEGPVFSVDELKKLSEFGEYKRDGSGTRVKL
jgi:dihydroorotate dehydrogenase electron transfer subunit